MPGVADSKNPLRSPLRLSTWILGSVCIPHILADQKPAHTELLQSDG